MFTPDQAQAFLASSFAPWVQALNLRVEAVSPEGHAILSMPITDDVARMGFDDRFRRMWNFYLTSCAGAFHGGNCDVTQITIARPR